MPRRHFDDLFHVRDRARGFANTSRSLAVGKDAEGGLPFQLEQVGQKLQLIRDIHVAGQGTGHAVEYT